MARRTAGSSSLIAGVITLLIALFMIAPAFADPGNGNGKGREKKASGSEASDHDGDADSDPGTAYTEDNDTNDGDTPNNVSDEGDNKHPSGKDRSTENGNSANQGNSESDPDDDGHGPDRSNGGPDKPNGSGGEDLADQDGNNGCGNDDDFEDDNEGWCGHKPKPEGEAEGEAAGEVLAGAQVKPPCDEDSTMPATQPCAEIESEVRPLTPCEDVTMPTTDVQCGEGESEEAETPGIPGAVLPGLEQLPAQEQPTTPDVVLGSVIHRGTPRGSSVLGEQVSAATEEAGAVLPFTGGSVLPFALVALALVGVGVLLTSRARRSN